MQHHSNAIFEAGGAFYQALCSCGRASSVSYYQEVDLLRALHAHDMVFSRGEDAR